MTLQTPGGTLAPLHGMQPPPGAVFPHLWGVLLGYWQCGQQAQVGLHSWHSPVLPPLPAVTEVSSAPISGALLQLLSC